MQPTHKLIRALSISTALLLLPYMSSLLFDGWNWTAIDFVFAWVLFSFLSVSITYITTSTMTRPYKIMYAVVTIGVLLLVWAQAAVDIV